MDSVKVNFLIPQKMYSVIKELALKRGARPYHKTGEPILTDTLVFLLEKGLESLESDKRQSAGRKITDETLMDGIMVLKSKLERMESLLAESRSSDQLAESVESPKKGLFYQGKWWFELDD